MSASPSGAQADIQRRVDFNRGQASYWPTFCLLKAQWMGQGSDPAAREAAHRGLHSILASPTVDLETAAECRYMLGSDGLEDVPHMRTAAAMYSRLLQVAVANGRQEAAQKFRILKAEVEDIINLQEETTTLASASAPRRATKRVRFADEDDEQDTSTSAERPAHGDQSTTPCLKAMPIRTSDLSTHRNSQRFRRTILNEIMSHPELMLAFVANLTPASLLNLYAISKPFHYLFNRHYTSFMLANVRTRCGPDAETIFPFYAYRRLCKLDPTERDVNAPSRGVDADSVASNSQQPAPMSGSGAPRVRQIPSIKWLTMVTHRVYTIRRITAYLWASGHLLSVQPTLLMLQKLWYMLDLPSNGLRIGYVHNRESWTDTDLKVAWFFFVSLDRRFTDPMGVDGSGSLRKLLFRGRNLTPLLETLERGRCLSTMELLRSVVHLNLGVSEGRLGYPVIGLPPQLVGRGQGEWRGRGRRRLLQPDQAVLMEMFRRRLHPEKLLLPSLLAGRSQQRRLVRMNPMASVFRRRWRASTSY